MRDLPSYPEQLITLHHSPAPGSFEAIRFRLRHHSLAPFLSRILDL